MRLRVHVRTYLCACGACGLYVGVHVRTCMCAHMRAHVHLHAHVHLRLYADTHDL